MCKISTDKIVNDVSYFSLRYSNSHMITDMMTDYAP